MPHSELAHHGVKGMKWGVRRTPSVAYHQWRSRQNGKAADRWEKRKDRVKVKNKANPMYRLYSNLAEDRREKAEKHQYENDFYEKFVKYNKSAVSMLNATTIKNGKAYVDELELR